MTHLTCPSGSKTGARWPLRALAAVLILVAACAPRADLVPHPLPAEDIEIGHTVSMFVGTTRAPAQDGLWSPEDRGTLNFAQVDVSVPPDRRPGQIRVARRDANPRTDFLTRRIHRFDGSTAFRAAIRDSLRARKRPGSEVVVTVHGFNNTMGEGVFRTAQMVHDLEIRDTVVHYSWPSIAEPLGYAADRDSALIARDGLEQLLKELRNAGARRIVLVAHSMGAHLTMETLRQISKSGNRDLMDRINGVVLMSPDLDIELFEAQARAIGELPQPFVIFVSRRDPVLALSARLTNQPNRLGNMDDIDAVAGLPVTVVDLSEARDAGNPHNVALTAPSVLKMLEEATGSVQTALQADPTGRTGFFPGTALVAQGAAAVLLAPVTVIGEVVN